ncbi:transporter [Luteibacter aegosomatissinici]|uniref:transporter n=1 Tax=Luteibacter aegosomatissinici TaxID=2911539 RepID=UPI001FFAC299|nr:transporter [Luteibacter aegosomatissinici]UPG95561.1 transporter [Luteibacter aegosomatissinici]
MWRRLLYPFAILLFPAAALGQSASAGNDAADLAQKLSNPVASLISVPFQFNYDQGLGPGQNGHRLTMNLQPVVPVSISDDWNMISRTILPVDRQVGVSGRGEDQFGLGDTTQSLFFSPKAPTAGGTIWGIGPAFLLPTATDDKIGSKKWGAGPTAVVLRQSHGITYGFLANQIWSVASVGGYRDRPPLSSLFLQPFISYTTPSAWTYGANLESTYDWHARQASVPINLTVAKLTKGAGMPISLTGGVRYWLHGADAGPHGWGFRAVVTLLFPK